MQTKKHKTKTMKTLSIRQPWASLIAYGIKDIENRTWKTDYRGKIYIHATKNKQEHISTYLSPNQLERYGYMIASKGIKPKLFIREFPISSILGTVEIVGCVRGHDSIWAEKDCWNWVLSNPILLDEPIYNVKGKLSLWNYKIR